MENDNIETSETKMNMKMKAVLFARVSTREQAEEGYSLPAQEKLLKDYASKHDLTIVKNFSVPESARGKQERKLFNELLDYVYKHPEVKIVLCEKVDRITRNLKDAVKLDDWLNEDETRQIHFVKQNLTVHKNAKSNDKFMWDMHIVLARQYSNNLSEETKKGLYEKAEQGYYPGNQKRGYKSIGDAGHKLWFIDKEKPDARFIEIAFVLYDTGNYTIRTLAQELFSQGWIVHGKPIAKSELHKLLSDPFYCGEFMFRNKLYKNGKHEPLISKELFYRVQERLQRVLKAGKYLKHFYLFGEGIIVCDLCGRTVTWELQKGHLYGHCTKFNTDCKKSKYVKEKDVEDQAKVVLDDFKIENPRLLEWVRDTLKESHKDESNYHAETIQELEKLRNQVEGRIDKLYDDRVDEKISREFYERKSAQYEKELDDVLKATEKHSKANISYLKLGINIFELALRGREVYEELETIQEKKELLNFVFLNFKLNEEKVVPTLHNGFDVVAKHAKTGDWLPGLDSNQNKRIQSPLSYH